MRCGFVLSRGEMVGMSLFLMLTATAVLMGPTFSGYFLTNWASGVSGGPYEFAPPALAALCVIAWSCWRRTSGLASTPDRPWAGAGLVILGVFLHQLGQRSGIIALCGMALCPILGGILLMFQPAARVFALAYPIVALLLLIPLPISVIDTTTILLRDFQTRLGGEVLSLFGYPVTREGFALLLQRGGEAAGVMIDGDCSGIRTLPALLWGSSFILHLRGASIARHAAVLAAVPLIAVAANAARIILTFMLVAHGMASLAGGAAHSAIGLGAGVAVLAAVFAMSRAGHI